MNISLFCPESNINDNPSMHGIIDLLCEKGHILNIIVGRRGGLQEGGYRTFNQVAPHANATLHLVDASFFDSAYRSGILPFEMPQGDLNIGIDDGIVVASFFATKYATPSGVTFL